MSAEYDEVLRGIDASRRAGWAHYYATLDTVAQLTAALLLVAEVSRAGRGHWSGAREPLTRMCDEEVDRAISAHQTALAKKYSSAEDLRTATKEVALGWGPHSFKPGRGRLADGLVRCARCGRTRARCEEYYLR